MGQTNNKMVATSEARLDQAVNSIELLNKSGKQTINGMMDIFRHLDNHVNTLKSEKEFLARQLQRIERKTYSHQGLQDKQIVFCEVDTQTESNEEFSLCILNESLSSRNKELEEEIANLRERIKLEATQTGGNLLSNIQLQGKLDLNEKKLQEMKLVNAKLDDRNLELHCKNTTLEKTVFDLQKNITERDATMTDLEQKVSQLVEQNEISVNKKEEKKIYLEELKKQIQNKESELSDFKQNMETHLKKMKNELSLEAVNFQNEKLKTKDMGNKVLQLEEQISDLKIMNNKLETVIEINETTATQEKVKLQEIIVGKSNDYVSLFEKYESLEKEKKTLPHMKKSNLLEKNESLEKGKETLGLNPCAKKGLSFHSVLRQPQSDQAVMGIVSLLQSEMPNTQLEVIQEEERTGDNPLLVVLYNLSNLITDAKSALSGIEAAPNVALVVLHAKAIKKPSKHIITELEFKKLGIIVDMSFLSAKGIISNELTDDAIKQLVEFVNRF